MTGLRTRAFVKRHLAAIEGQIPAPGASFLIYHRVGAGTRDELDVPTADFRAQLDALQHRDVVAIDVALDRLDRGDTSSSVVLTFDDGFADVYDNAWPLLRARGMPFTIYLATAYMGQPMVWEGSTAQGPHGHGMTWTQLEEMLESGLCTIGNHTHNHARPDALSDDELDLCSAAIEHRLGVRPAHFTYPWGVVVPRMEASLRERFRSVSTGILGRNHPSTDTARLRRIPVRQSDPIEFYSAKLEGRLLAERSYGALVDIAKVPRRVAARMRGRSPV